jgi:hypothetical protein
MIRNRVLPGVPALALVAACVIVRTAHAEDTQAAGPVVHLDAASSIVLERADGAVVCRAPCDRAVDPEPPYRVEGPDMRPSATFHIAENADHVTIVPHPKSASTFRTGIVLTAIGATLFTGGAATGIALAAMAANDHSVFSGFGEGLGALIVAPIGILGLSLAIPGLLMMLGNTHSDALQTTTRVEAREPTWTPLPIKTPGYTSVPVFQTAF